MKTYLVLAGVALVFILLIVRFFFTERNSSAKEREWFAHNVRYEFSVTVDSIVLYGAHTGRLYCRVAEGNPNVYREDSLKNSLKKHDKLRIVLQRKADSVAFVLQNANQVTKGDSIRISSKQNTLQVFRSGKLVSNTPLSDAVVGWGRVAIGNP
jgi:uncharacterized membrane protein YvbJ